MFAGRCNENCIIRVLNPPGRMQDLPGREQMAKPRAC